MPGHESVALITLTLYLIVLFVADRWKYRKALRLYFRGSELEIYRERRSEIRRALAKRFGHRLSDNYVAINIPTHEFAIGKTRTEARAGLSPLAHKDIPLWIVRVGSHR